MRARCGADAIYKVAMDFTEGDVGIMKRYERFGESSAEESAVKMIIGDAIDNVREYSDSDLEALYERYKVMKKWLNEVVDAMPTRE